MVYFVRHLESGEIKIGYSGCVTNRMQPLLATVGRIELLAVIQGERDLERAHHAWFAAFALGHEWFLPGEELMAYIAGLTSCEPVGIVRNWRAMRDPTDADLREEQRILDMYERHEARIEPEPTLPAWMIGGQSAADRGLPLRPPGARSPATY